MGNHMISSAICDKSAQVNFSKTNQIARALRATAIWLVQFTGADLPQIEREKSRDYLLMIYMHILTCCSSVTCHHSLLPPTNDNLDQDWSKFWQVNIDG